jgi:hypothetical protein
MLDDIALFELVVERALRQQHFHQIQMEIQGFNSKRLKFNRPAQKQQGGWPKLQGWKSNGATHEDKPKHGTPKIPPRDGCLVCRDTHWLKDCPTATTEQKVDLKRFLQQKWDRDRMKTANQSQMPSQATNLMVVELIGVLDVLFCAESGAETNIVAYQVISELCVVDDVVVMKPLDPPVVFPAAGDFQLSCRVEVTPDLGICTIAGNVRLAGVKFLV